MQRLASAGLHQAARGSQRFKAERLAKRVCAAIEELLPHRASVEDELLFGRVKRRHPQLADDLCAVLKEVDAGTQLSLCLWRRRSRTWKALDQLLALLVDLAREVQGIVHHHDSERLACLRNGESQHLLLHVGREGAPRDGRCKVPVVFGVLGNVPRAIEHVRLPQKVLALAPRNRDLVDSQLALERLQVRRSVRVGALNQLDHSHRALRREALEGCPQEVPRSDGLQKGTLAFDRDQFTCQSALLQCFATVDVVLGREREPCLFSFSEHADAELRVLFDLGREAAITSTLRQARNWPTVGVGPWNLTSCLFFSAASSSRNTLSRGCCLPSQSLTVGTGGAGVAGASSASCAAPREHLLLSREQQAPPPPSCELWWRPPTAAFALPPLSSRRRLARLFAAHLT